MFKTCCTECEDRIKDNGFIAFGQDTAISCSNAQKEEETEKKNGHQQKQQQIIITSSPIHNNNNNNNKKLDVRGKFYQWARMFRRSDPRFRILEFFHSVEQDGCKHMCHMNEDQSKCVEGCFEPRYFDNDDDYDNSLYSSRSTTTTTTTDCNHKSNNKNTSFISRDDTPQQQSRQHLPQSRSSRRPNYAKVPSNCFNRAGVFSVWRPCSYEAIQKMMTGQGVGKGLDIKGKSAKQGTLSGFVPFLQIHEEQHKTRIKTLPKDARLRLFFKTEQGRKNALDILEPLVDEMIVGHMAAKEIIEDQDSSLRTALRASTLVSGVNLVWEDSQGTLAAGVADREEALNRHMWDLGSNSSIDLIDDYAPNFYGIDVSQRLFWEGFVMRQKIARDPEYETGRPSCAEFLDCNFKTLAKNCNKTSGKSSGSGTRPVILQYQEDPKHAMCVQNLLMAYEDEDQRRVMPVISDFDCFLLGTRRVSFHEELPERQKDLLKWQVAKIESILDNPSRDETWTMQWLEMLKSEVEQGYHPPEAPKFGFGDPKSYFIMGHAVARLAEDGCVRHGAECFNYNFPQDLDDKFFVISSRCKSLALELDRVGLVSFLSQKADEGYLFPLNPKWVLCDLGFKQIYDKLMANQKLNAQVAMKTWFPPETGIRDAIERIHKKHPDGFQRSNRMYFMKQRRYSPLRQCVSAGYDIDGATAMEMALLELQHYENLLRCKAVAHAIIASIRMYAKIQLYNRDNSSSGSLVQYHGPDEGDNDSDD